MARVASVVAALLLMSGTVYMRAGSAQQGTPARPPSATSA